MFGGRSRTEDEKGQGGDERLSALLHEWKDVEPPVGFEAAVWQRIRAVPTPEQRRLSLRDAWREWFGPRPVWVNAVAAAAGIIIGVGLAFSGAVLRDGRHADDRLLHSETLAGSYLTMVTGENR